MRESKTKMAPVSLINNLIKSIAILACDSYYLGLKFCYLRFFNFFFGQTNRRFSKKLGFTHLTFFYIVYFFCRNEDKIADFIKRWSPSNFIKMMMMIDDDWCLTARQH